MRGLVTTITAGLLFLGMTCAAYAVDVKISGRWDFTFGWAENFRGYGNIPGGGPGFKNKDQGNGVDSFNARHRARTQFDFIASEQLSAQLLLEVGDISWGRDGTYTSNGRKSGQGAGGDLDSDGVNVETKRAFLDWMIPNTEVMVRMGIQGIYMPTGTGYYTPVYGTDAPGILISAPLTDYLGVTAFWVRGLDRYDDDSSSFNGKNSMDEMDIFGLILPITLEGMKITPWGMYTFIGGDSGFWSYHNMGFGSGEKDGFDGSTKAWHMGVAYELTMFDPLSFSMDVVYGNLAGHGNGYTFTGEDRSSNPGTQGWFVDAALRYKMDWATAGLFGWWASGDTANSVDDGRYGRIPSLSNDQGFTPTSFGFDGSPAHLGSDRGISNSGVGTMGIGIELKDISFLEDLSHLIRFAYIRGTNDHEVIENYNGSFDVNGRRAPFLYMGEYQYMTDKDWAFEINFDHTYKIYENLTAMLELGYLHMHLDNDTWSTNNRWDGDTSDAWKAQMHFLFSF